MRHPKRLRDTNQLAKSIVDEAMGEATQGEDTPKVKRARAGGFKGGRPAEEH